MRKTGQNLISLLMVPVIIMGSLLFVAKPVHAMENVQYIYRSWDATNKTVVTETRTADCVDYNSSMTNLHQGWWYVNGKHEVENRVNVSGEVNIIILDGSTLYLKDGIRVPAGSTLNIYNTPGGENGHLHALVDTNSVAAIGGNNGEAGGNINIHSGKVTADAYNDNKGEDGAGIGGGNMGSGGTVTIYGGTVVATGANYGAGIGSGDADADNIHGGFVRIYGGNVTANGGTDSAGIGGGEGADGANVEIWGGKVTAQGGSTNEDGGAGIGSGDDDGRAKSGGTTKIYGGEVHATGGADGAGIGGGDGCSGGDITIAGGTITAAGGVNGAGIGGGDDAVWTKIEITGGNVEAQGGDYAAGIGSGDRDSLTDGGEIIISGGTVKATGGSDGAGIGGGEDCTGGIITISGGTVTATGGTNTDPSPDSGGAGIGGGDGANGGTINITGAEKITANGGAAAAGIGGGDNKGGGKINISGGKEIIATGGFGGAGIGGGDGGSEGSGDITISGGNITANGGDEAAGIGGGNQSGKENPGTITISGGTVTANGGENYGAGIGGGDEQSGGTINIINAEKITAIGGKNAAGIGGGDDEGGGKITISGGKEINATGGFGGAGIGGGDGGYGGSGDITIQGGTVIANGGDEAAGIGGGNNSGVTNTGTITISGGTVTANGGENYGAGIGGGDEQSGGAIIITGAEKITATGGKNAAGIGGGDGSSGNGGEGGTITISGGKEINATGGDGKAGNEDNGGAGIGGGYKGSGGLITITDGKITAQGGIKAAGIGGGNGGVGGTISINGGEVEANGGWNKSEQEKVPNRGGAGIGGGNEGSGGKITIGGGKVNATGGRTAAGIGGGSYGEGGEINISGGDIRTFGLPSWFDRREGIEGAEGGAGVGGGSYRSGGTITISGGKITSSGGSAAAGIGGGCQAKSGSIRISGGTIDAGGGDGGAGIGSGAMCDETSNAVDVTIESGQIRAWSSDPNWYHKDEVSYNVAAGACIGAGGYSWPASEGNASVAEESYFAGSIILNGGTVHLIQRVGSVALGTTGDYGLEGVTGKVEFNGALVIKEDWGLPGKMVKASNVVLKENDNLHQSVSKYSTYPPQNDEHLLGTAKKDERIGALNEAGQYVVVEPCAHRDSTFTDVGDETHTRTCLNCNLTNSTEAHTYGQPTWAWTDDNTKAVATFKCACGHEKTVDATVELKADDPTKYVATATLDGKTYTAEADRLIYDITVVDSDHGSIEVNSTARAGAEVGLDVVPDDHYHLKSVAGDGVTLNHVEGNHYTFTMPKGNVTLRAEFDIDTYEVIWKDYDGTALHTDTVAYGESYTLPEADTFTKPEGKCGFKSLELKAGSADAVAKEPGETVEIEDDTTITAVWKDHDWSEISYEWAADDSTVTAARVCNNDESHNETETVETAAMVTKEATCTEKGETTYTSAAFQNTAFEVQTKTEEMAIDPNAHNYKFKGFTWTGNETNGYTAAVANYECEHNNEHTTTADAAIAETITDPTCTEAGKTTYTATVAATDSPDGQEHSESKEAKTTDALEHSYKFTGFTWTGNETNGYTAAVANYECEHNNEHTTTAVATISEDVLDPTCTEAGKTIYTATVAAADSPDGQAHEESKDGKPTDALKHKWKFTEFTWTGNEKDGYTASVANYECEHNSEHKMTADAAIGEAVTDPTCTEDGKTIYTATVAAADSPDGQEHSASKDAKPTDALDHDWNAPAYEWAADNSSVTATRTCKHNNEHSETETVDVASGVSKPATCISKGETTYTAEFENTAFTKQTKTFEDIEVDANAHEWNDPTYEWSKDNKTVTATHKCKQNATHMESETADTTAETTAPTCEKAGKTVYTATFTKSMFENQTRTVDVKATGHKWETPTYTWSKDNSTVTATRICSNDKSHKETETVKTTSKTTEATTTKEGKTVYTATFKNSAFKTQTKEVAIPKKPVEKIWYRLYGNTGLDTMKAIVEEGFTKTGGTVVVATKDGFKDALAAAGFAGLYKAPIVLTDGTKLSAQAQQELKRLKPARVFVVGGPVPIKEAVLAGIQKATGVKPVRYYGANSTATSAELANRGKGKWKESTAIIATNKSFKDALSVAPIAYAKGYPILLADNGTTLTKPVLDALKNIGTKQVIIVGGEAAVTKNVVSQLNKAGIKVKVRLQGANGVKTSAAIANWGLKNGMTANKMGVATSQGYSDALSGAALCGINKSVLVLADDKAMDNAGFPKPHKAQIKKGYVFGGEAAVGKKTWNALNASTK